MLGVTDAQTGVVVGSRNDATRDRLTTFVSFIFWLAVIVIVLTLGVVTQRRHRAKTLRILRSLLGRRVRLAIWTGNRSMLVRNCFATIAAVDSRTRWVSLHGTAWDVGPRHDEVESSKGDVLHELERTGVIADRIKWIEPHGSNRIRLN